MENRAPFLRVYQDNLYVRKDQKKERIGAKTIKYDKKIKL